VKSYRAALLGCGQVSRYQLRAWSQIEGVEIVALCNRTVERARERAREFGIPPAHVYADYRELFERETLDFVDIATAPHVHREQVETAAGYGLPVLCQKPLAGSSEDILAMTAACERAGVLLSVNENWRWRGWYRALRDLLQRNLLGRPRYLRITSHRNITLPSPAGDPPPLLGKQPYTAGLEQLIVYEWGTHLIDVARALFGQVRSVYARMDRASRQFKGEDRAVIVLEFDQATGLIDISWATAAAAPAEAEAHTYLEHVLVEGDHGLIEIIPEPHKLLRVSTRSEAWERPAFTGSPEAAYQASYTAAQQHFIDCLRTGRTPETAADDHLKTMAAAFAAYQSAAQNQVVCPEYP
jgi:predicted dehydrogenase